MRLSSGIMLFSCFLIKSAHVNEVMKASNGVLVRIVCTKNCTKSHLFLINAVVLKCLAKTERTNLEKYMSIRTSRGQSLA
jgi:hypothetical protein